MSEQLIRETPDFDVLGDVLEALRFRSTIFFCSDLAAPWGMSLAPLGTPRFHIAMKGDCVVGVTEGEFVKLEERDIVMLPSGDSHWIADQFGRDLVSSELAGEACELNRPFFQEGELTHRLMCGVVKFDQQVAHPILESLPPMIHFPHSLQDRSIWMTVSLIDAEMQRVTTSADSIADRLAEVLFIKLLNHYLNEDPSASGFLGALGDRRIRRALMLIHREPDFGWTLAELGERVGMSRATLTRHFQDSVGVAPMTYVSNWRLLKAYHMVKQQSGTLEEIAESVGFASTRALNKAFQRRYGNTPHQLRRASSSSSSSSSSI